MSDLPRIERIAVTGPHRLDVFWRDGASGTADLSAIVARFAPFAPLQAPEVFATATVVNWGSGIEWPDTGLDYSAFRLRQITEAQAEFDTQMSAEEFVAWQSSAGLTVALTARLLDMGERQIIKYRQGDAVIPRAVKTTVRQFQNEPGLLNAVLPKVMTATQ